MPLVKITDVCDIQVGKTPSRSNPSFWGEGPLWLSIADMNQGSILKKTKETITEKAVKECNCKIVPKNTVLFSFKLSIGKVGITEVPMYTNEAIAAFLIKDHSKIDIKYLFYVLQRFDYSIGSNKAVMGKTLNKAQLQKIEIPLPSIEEQTQIIKILDQADTLRQKRKKTIRLLDDYLKSIFLDIFGDPEINNNKFYFSSIGNLCKVKGGKRIPKGESLVMFNTGHPYIKAGNIKDGKVNTKSLEYVTEKTFSKIRNYIVKEGDVCITIVGANIGDIGIVPKELHNANLTENAAKLVILDSDKLSSTYLAYFLTTPYAKKNIKKNSMAVGVPKLALFRLEELRVPLPPVSLQNKFALISKNIESIKQNMLAQSVELKNQFQSLMQKAFRGEL